MTQKKKRRRVVRISDAADYDRTADQNTPAQSSVDDDRMVIFDSELSPEPEPIDDPHLTLEDYLEQRPPHHS